jgi:hypothetical protein
MMRLRRGDAELLIAITAISDEFEAYGLAPRAGRSSGRLLARKVAPASRPLNADGNDWLFSDRHGF